MQTTCEFAMIIEFQEVHTFTLNAAKPGFIIPANIRLAGDPVL